MAKEAVICITGNSPLLVARLKELVRLEKGFELCAASGMAGDTLQKLKSSRPDVVVIAMGGDAHELKSIIEGVQRFVNAPVIVLAENGELRKVAEHAGAYDFIQMVSGMNALARVERDLVMRMRLASAVKAVAPMMRPNTPAHASHLQTAFSGVLALGASCGGTDAILDVICRLPRNTPGIAVVQHMPSGFTSMYAERLNRECSMRVIEATGSHKMQQGLVLLAPGDTQMRVVKRGDGYYTECFDGPKVTGHKPSVDVLFSSVANSAGGNSVGIILTGMGSDGAKGLLEMRRAGAYTIGQDERSSVVYGMPRVAYEAGAVTTQVPLAEVAKTLLAHLAKAR